LRLQADAGRLIQILVNLLNNAVKYTEPGGQIWLEVQRVESQIVIRIRDTGVGIPQELLPHVFELFTQGEWTVEYSQGGMGIGLALVRRLVELHGGTITASSPGLGMGSEFVVTLPTLPAERPDPEPTQSPHVPAPVSNKPLSRRILLVDDNVDAAKTLKLLLAKDGHIVQVTYDGPSALKLAAEFRPDVVLLDIGLPRMDGYQVARRLRDDVQLKDTFMVALTGFGQEDDRRLAQEAGFDAHLLKPIRLEALRELLVQSSTAAND